MNNEFEDGFVFGEVSTGDGGNTSPVNKNSEGVVFGEPSAGSEGLVFGESMSEQNNEGSTNGEGVGGFSIDTGTKKPSPRPMKARPIQQHSDNAKTLSTERTAQTVGNSVRRVAQQPRPQSQKSTAVPDPNVTVQQRRAMQQNGQQFSVDNNQGVGNAQYQQAQVQQEVHQNTKKKQKKQKQPKQPKEKKAGSNKGKKVVLGVGIAVILLGGAFAAKTILFPKPMEYNYETSGRKVYDNLISLINNYDAKKLDSFIGREKGDSFLAQEWSYANKNSVREEYIKKITSLIKFSYPQVEQLSTKGTIMVDKDDNPIMIESFMNSGEKVIISVPDWTKIAEKMKNESDTIIEMGIMEDIKKTDYDYQDECFDLMLSYILTLEEVPMQKVEVSIPISGGMVSDDADLDNALFASQEYHDMCDQFDKIMTGYTGFKTETYIDKEEVHNPEYDEWYKIFKERYDADNGVFNKYKSQWEPWYVYDSNNKVQTDENGKWLVRYYSVKDKDGNDWIQPSKTIFKDVEKVREVPDEYVPEKAVPYCFLGAWYAQNEYDGDVPSEVRIGDGSVKHPAGVGTPIITKVKGTDGKYHDCKITMLGYWVGKEGIDYAISFSERNKGFDPDSPVQLICYEMRIDNLEDKDFTFDSEMMLCDKNASRTGRTGTMYGFNYEGVTVKAKDSLIFNDWATSTEIEQKYVAWGKSFDRQVEPVFFKVLAGTGKIPSYSAYKEFTGHSTLEEEQELQEAERRQNGDEALGSEETETTEGDTIE